MKYSIKRTSQFKKDFKQAVKRGLKIELLVEVITLLSEGKTLPPKYNDHALVGDYAHFRECHITPDWLLIYLLDGENLILTLVRTGSHSNLF